MLKKVVKLQYLERNYTRIMFAKIVFVMQTVIFIQNMLLLSNTRKNAKVYMTSTGQSECNGRAP